MGKICVICNGRSGVGYRLFENRWICVKCMKQAGGFLKLNSLKRMKTEEIHAAIEENVGNASEKIQLDMKKRFKATYRAGLRLSLDENSRIACFKGIYLNEIPNITLGIGKNYYVKYEDILGFELFINGIVKVGIGNAANEKVDMGSVFVPSNSRILIKVMLNDAVNPRLYIKLLGGKVQDNTTAYKYAVNLAYKITIKLEAICKENGTSNIENKGENIISVADEIKKYKELLDIGAITEEEFKKKKKQLLEM